MVLRQHGFPAICFNGESYGKGDNEPTNKILQTYASIVKKRFKYQLLFLDNDAPGIAAASVISKKTGISYVTTGSKFKDISDYQRKYGPQKTYRKLKKIITSKFKLRKDEVPF